MTSLGRHKISAPVCRVPPNKNIFCCFFRDLNKFPSKVPKFGISYEYYPHWLLCWRSSSIRIVIHIINIKIRWYRKSFIPHFHMNKNFIITNYFALFYSWLLCWRSSSIRIVIHIINIKIW